ncbi:U-box domain-containing protein [Musa troglodytarum]|uniref:RING-type E3 ubiquitin transferase n=1 Tax=Musa troglodytarum TaxID=320322 RepID=A0A9E7IJS9_9LILI|nr:U-box domain-containing protein [Musa troglodytarum]
MTSPFAYLCFRRRRSPLSGAFFVPGDLSGAALFHALAALSADVASASARHPSLSQCRNARSLVRRVRILAVLFEFLEESFASSPSSPLPPWFPASAALCFREFYIFVYRTKLLVDYCSQSSRLWLLLKNPQISGNFHDLTQELATLLDVLPLDGLRLAADVREQIELLRRQCRRSKLFVDPDDEELCRKIFFFLSQFETGEALDPAELRDTFVHRLGIRDAGACRAEIEFLEEQISNQEEDMDLPLVSGVIALTRYCRFLLFGFQEMDVKKPFSDQGGTSRKRLLSQGSGSFSLTIPKDFCCPISLDLMKDPVVVSTGQTYDRASITQWMEEGHRTCPNSGLTLAYNRLVPNRALASLIAQWCASYGIPYGTPEGAGVPAESTAAACASRAAIEANRATSRILVRQLSAGSQESKTVAACELRLLAKTGKENRSFIAEAGAIPALCRLFRSPNPVAQENAVTAILNISIHDGNKSRIMDEEGCLKLIVYVLRHGLTNEARENAAATLFSLSAVHGFKKMIVDEQGAVAALANLLMQGSSRGKKDAVMALFNLSTHPQSWSRMLDMGAVSALVGALRDECVAEEAAGALALLMRHPILAQTVGSEDTVITNLVGLMRRGTPKGKENAVAALQEMCRRCGLPVTQKVARMQVLAGMYLSQYPWPDKYLCYSLRVHFAVAMYITLEIHAPLIETDVMPLLVARLLNHSHHHTSMSEAQENLIAALLNLFISTHKHVVATLYNLLSVEAYRSIESKKLLIVTLVDLLDAPNALIRSIKDTLKALFGLVLYMLNCIALVKLYAMSPLFTLVVKDKWRGVVNMTIVIT